MGSGVNRGKVRRCFIERLFPELFQNGNSLIGPLCVSKDERVRIFFFDLIPNNKVDSVVTANGFDMTVTDIVICRGKKDVRRSHRMQFLDNFPPSLP